MGVIILIIVGILAYFFISIGKNNKKCEQSSKMNDLNFESEVKRVLNDFVANYKTEDLYTENVVYVFLKHYEFKSELNLEKLADVMQGKITFVLEENGLMLKIAEKQKKFLKDAIKYIIPFHKEGYSLTIVVGETGKNKIFDICIGIYDKAETEISTMCRQIDELEKDSLSKETGKFFDRLLLIGIVDDFIKLNNLNFEEHPSKDDVFLFRAKKIEKKEINQYFKSYEENGIIKKGTPFQIKAALYTDKYCALLADFLAERGYNFTENFSDPEKKDNITRYKMIINNWAECVFTEILFSDAVTLIIAARELK